MTHDLTPQLDCFTIADLRPTQMTLGLREVSAKRAEWQKRRDRDGGEFLGRHMVPAVLGPKGRAYIVDHHHLVRALHEESVRDVLVSVVADLHRLEKSAFWVVMQNRNWLHLFDQQGELKTRADLPKSIADLADDPYRSLAGVLREAGGYAKDNTPYSEFLWADFLRRRIDAKALSHDFEAATGEALALARGKEANYLPGWCGPT